MSGARAVCVTRSASGHTVTIAVGWTLGVDLHSPNSAWSTPSEIGARLLHQIGGVRRGTGSIEVAYRALAPGRTTLRAFERPVCQAGVACPQFILVWELNIHVSGP